MKKLRAYLLGRRIVIAFNKKEANEILNRFHIFRNVATGKVCETVSLLKGDIKIVELDEDNHVLEYYDHEDKQNYDIFAISDNVNSELNYELENKQVRKNVSKFADKFNRMLKGELK